MKKDEFIKTITDLLDIKAMRRGKTPSEAFKGLEKQYNTKTDSISQCHIQNMKMARSYVAKRVGHVLDLI